MSMPHMETQPSLLTVMTKPFLLLYAGFLAVMVALSFELPILHDGAMAVRWPALGLMAIVGLGLTLLGGMPRMSATHVFLFVFLVVLGCSAAYSPDPSYTLLRTVSVGLLALAALAGLYTFARRPENAIALTDMLWLLGSVLVIGGFLYRRGDMGPGGRYLGLHDRATGAGIYAALFVPLALYQVRYRLRGIMCWAGWAIFALLMLQIVLTGARMALLVTVVLALLLTFAYFGKKTLLALLAGTLLLPVPFLIDRRATIQARDRSETVLRRDTVASFTGRLQRWQFGVSQFVERPFWGHGFGASRTIASREAARTFDIDVGEVFYLHSDQIEVLIDVGLFGFLFFALFWLSLAKTAVETIAQPPSPRRQLALAYLCGVALAFVDTFMHGGFLAAGGGVSAFTWSMIATFVALAPATVTVGVPRLVRQPVAPVSRTRAATASMPARHSSVPLVEPAAKPRRFAMLRERLPSVHQLAGDRAASSEMAESLAGPPLV